MYGGSGISTSSSIKTPAPAAGNIIDNITPKIIHVNFFVSHGFFGSGLGSGFGSGFGSGLGSG